MARKFRLGPKIGQGSQGEVYAGVNVYTGQEVAIKLVVKRNGGHDLQNEAKAFRVLSGGCKLFCLAFSIRSL